MDYPWIFTTVAAWSMGLSLLAYLLLAVTGIWIFWARQTCNTRPNWLRSLHCISGGILVCLVLLLLTIGILGTLSHFGQLGHSLHFQAGLTLVALVLLSFGSATQIGDERPWARTLHIGTNISLFFGFLWVSLTGWKVMQAYLP